jgi:hypothetical protein
MKKVTISSKNINAKQWSNLILELNLIKKQWSNLMLALEIQAPGLKKILALRDTKLRPSRQGTKSD